MTVDNKNEKSNSKQELLNKIKLIQKFKRDLASYYEMQISQSKLDFFTSFSKFKHKQKVRLKLKQMQQIAYIRFGEEIDDNGVIFYSLFQANQENGCIIHRRVGSNYAVYSEDSITAYENKEVLED